MVGGIPGIVTVTRGRNNNYLQKKYCTSNGLLTKIQSLQVVSLSE